MPRISTARHPRPVRPPTAPRGGAATPGGGPRTARRCAAGRGGRRRRRRRSAGPPGSRRAGPAGWRPPLDEHHTAVVEQLGQPQVGHLAELVEPVDVEVVDGETASYCWARVKVGLVMGSVTSSARPNPWVNAVLPAPRSPARTIRSPGPRQAPTAAAKAWVSSTDPVRAVSAAASTAPRLPTGVRTPPGAQRPMAPATTWVARARTTSASATTAPVVAATKASPSLRVWAGNTARVRPVVGALRHQVATHLGELGVGGHHTDGGVAQRGAERQAAAPPGPRPPPGSRRPPAPPRR